MAALRTIDQAVAPVLKSGRVGTVVAARVFLPLAKEDTTLAALGESLATAGNWIGDEPRRVTATGSTEERRATVLVEYRKGQTAIATIAPAEGTAPQALVIGNRGVLSWEPGDLQFAIAELRLEDKTPENGDNASSNRKSKTENRKSLAEAVELSLRERRPVALDGKETAKPQALPIAFDFSPGDAKPKQLAPPFGMLLIAGGHTHQEHYAKEFAADPRCKLIGLADAGDISNRRRMLNERLAHDLGIPVFADLDEALARDDVQAVSVCAEPERRSEIILKCAAAGKHLYLDKPLCATARQADDIAAAIAKAGVISQMFTQVRTPPGERVRRLIESKLLGNVRSLHFDMLFAKGRPGTAKLDKPRREAAQPERFEAIESKRELYNVGVYPLAKLLWLLQRPVKRVYATTGNYFFAEHEKNDMEDFGAMLLELEGGATASLIAGRSGWRSHPMGGLNRTTVVAAEGSVTIDAHRPRIEVWSDEEPWQPPRRHEEDPMGHWNSTCAESGLKPRTAWSAPPVEVRSDFAYFLDCLEQGRPSDLSAPLAAAATKLILAGYQSAASGNWVTTGE